MDKNSFSLGVRVKDKAFFFLSNEYAHKHKYSGK